jgi:hypothetical protein
MTTVTMVTELETPHGRAAVHREPDRDAEERDAVGVVDRAVEGIDEERRTFVGDGASFFFAVSCRAARWARQRSRSWT